MGVLKNLEFSEKHIRIFELLAEKRRVHFNEGEIWCFIKEITPEIRSLPFLQGRIKDSDDIGQIPIKPIAARLDTIIQNDIRERKDFRIHHVQMTNHIAVALYAEGRINSSHLFLAEERVDQNNETYIYIPGIVFLGKAYRAVIYSETSTLHGNMGFATIDEFGEIIR